MNNCPNLFGPNNRIMFAKGNLHNRIHKDDDARAEKSEISPHQ